MSTEEQTKPETVEEKKLEEESGVPGSSETHLEAEKMENVQDGSNNEAAEKPVNVSNPDENAIKPEQHLDSVESAENAPEQQGEVKTDQTSSGEAEKDVQKEPEHEHFNQDGGEQKLSESNNESQKSDEVEKPVEVITTDQTPSGVAEKDVQKKPELERSNEDGGGQKLSESTNESQKSDEVEKPVEATLESHQEENSIKSEQNEQHQAVSEKPVDISNPDENATKSEQHFVESAENAPEQQVENDAENVSKEQLTEAKPDDLKEESTKVEIEQPTNDSMDEKLTTEKVESEKQEAETVPEETEIPDDDEDAKNPAYIPRKGAFYMHDSRKDDDEEKVGENQRKSRADKKWSHDLFDDRQQRPKSKTELIRKYGFDIRHGEKDETEEGRKPREVGPRRGGGATAAVRGRSKFQIGEWNTRKEPEERSRPVKSGTQNIQREIEDREPRERENRRQREPVRGGGGTHRGASKEVQPSPPSNRGQTSVYNKRTVIPSTAKRWERTENDGWNTTEKKYDNNHNTRGGNRRPAVTGPTRNETNGRQNQGVSARATVSSGTPPRQSSTPTTPRTKRPPNQPTPPTPKFQSQGVRSPIVGAPRPLIPVSGGAFVPAPVVPVAMVPVVSPGTPPMNYPHPRQPTEIVYFDPNFQSGAPRTPPQPRERRTLEIAPPSQ